jgi:hypothetical protein
MEADTLGIDLHRGGFDACSPANSCMSPWLAIVDDEVLDSFDESV